MRLYSMPSSGNSYKVRLLLALTGQTVELIDVPASSAALDEARTTGALPFGRAPALVLDDGTTLPESGAILWYLAQGTRFIPSDPLDQSRMLAWMFWEQYSHEPVIAVRAALLRYPDRAAQATPERLADLLDRGHAVLYTLDQGLTDRDWLVGDGPSLADIALYAYTHEAGPRGGFDMARYPSIAAWLDRVAALPRYEEIGA